MNLSVSYFINEVVSKEVFAAAVLSDEDSGMRQEVFSVLNYPNKTRDEVIASSVARWAVSTTGFSEGVLELSSDPATRLESLYDYPKVQIQSEDTSLSESYKALHPVIKQNLAG